MSCSLRVALSTSAEGALSKDLRAFFFSSIIAVTISHEGCAPKEKNALSFTLALDTRWASLAIAVFLFFILS